LVRNSLVGFGIALLCLIPPLIHFVTGPIGPLLGGFICGARAKTRPGQACGLGMLMGLFMAGPAVALVVVAQIAPSLIPEAARNTIFIVAAVVVAYTTILGTAGAMLGGFLALRDKGAQGPANAPGP